MVNISKYNDFILENKFNSIIDDIIFRVSEDVEGKWTGPDTITWEYPDKDNKKSDKIVDKILDFGDKSLNKLRDFIKNLPKEKIREYYIKVINKLDNLPDTFRKKLIVGITSVFITFVSLTYLISPSSGKSSDIFGAGLNDKQKSEIIQLTNKNKKSSFDKAQKLVKLVEAGYSDDRSDRGNYINTPSGRRFIGTNHGISAPILSKYFKDKGIKRSITKNDMINLSYKTALKIYKKNYWDDKHLYEISDQNVANIIYDGCVNQGSESMRSVLRKAFEENGIQISDDDVIFSSDVLKRANNVDPEKLFNSIKKYRSERYKDSETFRVHGDGWLNRLANINYTPDGELEDRT